jgi:glycine/D-amino acid oxidase-like deaminating enzyme
VVKHFVAEGGILKLAAIESPWNPGALKLSDGSKLQADMYVFACGPWLPRLFPDHLSHCIKPTKQDVLFVSTPPGSDQFTWQQLPCWADRTSKEVYYGIPDVQHRGFKLASDLRGREFDPDTESRLIDHESWQLAQDYLRRRFPLLGNSTLLETRVCQYENTPDLGLLVDRHPAADNVWFVGGGSGHGYKHGPALGEYVAAAILDRAPLVADFRLDRFTSGGPHTKATTISE